MNSRDLSRQCISAFFVLVILAITAHESLADRRSDYQRAVRNAARAERKLDKRVYDRRNVRDAYRAGAVSGAVRSEIRHNARHRVYRHISITRRHGHWYQGYGGYRQDNDAFKWLAFTAISLKILDMVNEDQQRRHEQAMIEATSARIGVPVTWRDGAASGRVVAVNELMNSDGFLCREFQQEIIVGGNRENGFGTACLQADGSWKIAQ